MTVKYTGSGYLLGIPARDLTDAEWAELSAEQKKAALESGLYKLNEKQTKEPPAKSGE